MRRLALLSLLTLAAACGGGRGEPGPAPVPADLRARAEMKDAQGRALGVVTLTQTPHGVLLSGDLNGLPAGVHALRRVEVATRARERRVAAADVVDVQRVHGFRVAAGHHAGDLPNFSAPASGSVRVDFLTDRVTVGTGPTSLMDADGSSLVVHSGSDDYATDPAGSAGDRIACGVIVR